MTGDNKQEIWISAVEVNCSDPAYESEMNDWYDNVHIPDCLTSPGYVSVTRYQIDRLVEGRGKYLTLYEIHCDDIERYLQIRNERRERERAIGGYDGGGQSAVAVGSLRYKLIRPRFTKENVKPAIFASKANPELTDEEKKAVGEASQIWVSAVEVNCSDPAYESEMNDWYDNVHIPDCLASPGYVNVLRYQIGIPKEGCGKYLTFYEIHCDDIDRCVQIRNERRERERALGSYDGGGKYAIGVGSRRYLQIRPVFTKENTPPAPYAYKANPIQAEMNDLKKGNKISRDPGNIYTLLIKNMGRGTLHIDLFPENGTRYDIVEWVK